jgi:hypothetical protein
MTESTPFQRPSNALPTPFQRPSKGVSSHPPITPRRRKAVGRQASGSDGVAAMEKHFSRVKGISDGQ